MEVSAGEVPVLAPLGALALRPCPNSSVSERRKVPVGPHSDDESESDELEADARLEEGGDEVENARREEDLEATRKVSGKAAM